MSFGGGGRLPAIPPPEPPEPAWPEPVAGAEEHELRRSVEELRARQERFQPLKRRVVDRPEIAELLREITRGRSQQQRGGTAEDLPPPSGFRLRERVGRRLSRNIEDVRPPGRGRRRRRGLIEEED
jgi:hypothetical protein